MSFLSKSPSNVTNPEIFSMLSQKEEFI